MDGNFLFNWFKIPFTYTAYRTVPIFRHIFKGSAGGYATIGIALFRIVYISTDFTLVLLHLGCNVYMIDFIPAREVKSINDPVTISPVSWSSSDPPILWGIR